MSISQFSPTDIKDDLHGCILWSCCKQCADDECGKHTWHYYTNILERLLGTIFGAAYLFPLFTLSKINLLQQIPAKK